MDFLKRLEICQRDSDYIAEASLKGSVYPLKPETTQSCKRSDFSEVQALQRLVTQLPCIGLSGKHVMLSYAEHVVMKQYLVRKDLYFIEFHILFLM